MFGWGQPQNQPQPSLPSFAMPQPQPQPQPYFATSFQARPDYQVKLDQMNQQIDRNSKACKFRTIFYTKVDDVNRYPQKPDSVPDRMWEDARENNPDPTCLVPVPAVGFQDLQKRYQVQNEESKKHFDLMVKYEKDIQNLKNYYELEITKKIRICKERQRDFEIRLMDVMIKQELSRASGALTYTEEQWKSQLESLQKELNNPNQFKARLYDLISTVNMKKNAHVQANVALDPQDVNKIISFLEEQTKVLTLLTSEIQNEVDSLEIMLEKFKEPLPGTDTKHYYKNY